MTQPYLLTTHQQIASAIAELLQSQAGTVRTQCDWLMLVFLLESISTGATHSPAWSPFSSNTEAKAPHSTEDTTALPGTQKSVEALFLEALNTFDLLVEEIIEPHAPEIFFKCCKTLSDLVRSDVYITAANFSVCIHCIRTFSEVSSCGFALEHDASIGRSVCLN